ncbi:MAG: adenosylmethionine decarboxylase [Candidatus Omnitrophica bacterium]|nr:adenosylmethionine decarboxylase [Candidatus Omnitrophota bacterium]
MKEKQKFCSTNGHISYAGIHLIIELWDAKNLSSLPKIRKSLKDSVKAIGATLLNINLHKFSPSGGVSGVAIISESHLSIHTWPEYKYAALDIFVCGQVDPYKAIKVLKKQYETSNIQINEIKRGIF